jgi:phosphoadenosine phosphosulfate reductase
MVEMGKAGKRFIHPIIDWSVADVWEYLAIHNIPHCCLYDEGFSRIGCVMCPMGGPKQMSRDMERWPKIAAAYKRAIEKGYRGQFPEMPTAQHVWEWWITGKGKTGEPENCLGFVFEG